MANVHGHVVDGEWEAVAALKQLDNEEAKVLFEFARHHGEAEFEGSISGHRKNFTLIREADGSHRVEEREEKKSGWF